MVRIQFMDFKKPKEFQPWVKLHVFWCPSIGLKIIFEGSFETPLGGYGRPSLKKTLKTDGLEDDPFPFGQVYSRGANC